MKEALNYLASKSYNLQDYKKMFGLTENELDMHIVNCYAGASVFVKEMTDLNLKAVACDPLYRKPIQDIKKTIQTAQQQLLEKIANHPEQFVKGLHESDILNLKGVEAFLEDLQIGLKEHRYTQDGLPRLHFKDEQFDLALISHYLFTNNEHTSPEYHVKAIQEFLRIAPEIRVFPLVTKESHLSGHIGEVAAQLQSEGLGVEIRGVPYEFQTHGNAMMRIWLPACSVKKHFQAQT